MEKKTKILMYIGISLIVVISLFYCGIIYWNNSRIIEIGEQSYDTKEELTIHVEHYSENEDSVTINGWCLKEKEDIGFANYYVVLHELNSKKYYKVNTGYQRRDDVTEHYNDGHNYGNSGFYANINKNKLPSGNYELCLWYGVNANDIFKSLNLFFVIK